MPYPRPRDSTESLGRRLLAQIACSRCGTQNDAERRFCIECGNRLAGGCPVCGTVNPPDAKFCGNCGSALTAGTAPAGMARGAEAAPVLIEPASAATTERRLVSVLFVDLVGFTTASEQRDAEDTRDLLSAYYDSARDIVGRYGGVVEKFIGDAVMAVWGVPSAHEDDAERAVRAALEIVATVPRLPRGDGDGPLQARAGVLTGEAAVALGLAGQGMVAGDLVNTASRLQSIARPGSVLVGEATFRAASRAIRFEPAGERELKGKERPVAVWEAVTVVGRRGGEGRSATLEPPFVGRDDELQLLKELFHTTAREGKPRLVTLTGVAGIGKSRLLWELEKYLDGVVEGVFWHAGRSPSYGEGISYWALAEMVRGRAGIAEGDLPADARARTREMVARFVPEETDRRWIEPRLLGLLGLDDLPAESRDELFAAWRTLFERIAAESPVVLGFWDLQWADQGLLDFIEHVLAWARSSPILVLAEARPELFDRRPSWGRNVRTSTVIHLEPLSPADMANLLTGLVPQMPAPALARIVERAEGVPLYAVETLRMLLDRGILAPDGAHYRLTGPLPELTVPETLHALILSRLDGLSAEERGLLSDASVLGISFSLPALTAVSGMHGDVAMRVLERLVQRELVQLEVDPRSPERGQHRFLQGVVREVAYQSIARRDRRAKHLAAARHFESLGEDELAGVLASHYLAAFRTASGGPEADALAAQARIALRAAADRAYALHDLLGALAYLEQALEVTTDLPDQAATHERAVAIAGDAGEFQRAHGHAATARSIYEELGDRLGLIRTRAIEASAYLGEHLDQIAIDSLQEALRDAADLGSHAEIAQAQSELARALMLKGEPEAVDWCDRVLAVPDVASPVVLLEALVTKGTALPRWGRELEGETLLRGAIEVADSAGMLGPGLRARNNLRANMMLTDLRTALNLTVEVRDLSLKFGELGWLLHATGACLDVAFRLGEWDRFDDAVGDVPDTSEFYAMWYACERARRQVYRGDPAPAEGVLDVALAAYRASESAQGLTWAIGGKADAQTAQGRFADAYQTAREGLERSENDITLTAALFAATGLADWELIDELRDVIPRTTNPRLALNRALSDAADCIAAVLDRRWDDAAETFRTAERGLDTVGDAVTLARLRLAVGHLGQDGPAVIADLAATAAEEARRFFDGRGASRYVTEWRSRASRLPSGATPSPTLTAEVAAVRRAR